MEVDIGILLAILSVLISLLITVFALLLHAGLLKEIEIRAGKPPFDSLVVAYKFERGPYKSSGHLFTEAHARVPELRTIGIYYDDPQEVAPADLRYVVGLILAEGEEQVNPDHQKVLAENGYKFVTLPAASHAVNTSFPFKNTVSIFLAVTRVYPKLSEYIRERELCAHPMIEVYGVNTIFFMAPLARQGEFYVPETKEEEGAGDTDGGSGGSEYNISGSVTPCTEDDSLLSPGSPGLRRRNMELPRGEDDLDRSSLGSTDISLLQLSVTPTTAEKLLTSDSPPLVDTERDSKSPIEEDAGTGLRKESSESSFEELNAETLSQENMEE